MISDLEKELAQYLKKEENNQNTTLEKYKRFKVNNYITTELWQKELKEMVIDYIKEKRYESQSIMLLGCSGSGKTHLSCAIGNYLSSINKKVVHYDFYDLTKRITNLFFTNGNFNNFYMSKIEKYDYIIIEDFFKEVSENSKRSAFILIDMLYTNNKKVILNSEKNIKQLINIDIAVYGRLKEMCKDNVFEIENKIENNYRLK